MSALAFLSLIAIYALVTIKIAEWITSSTLGDKLETSQLFFEHPMLCVAFGWVFLFVLVVVSFNVPQVKWYLCGLILLLARQSAIWYGQRRAFATFRRGCRYLIDFSGQFRDEPYTEEELTKLEADAIISDADLRARLKSYLSHRV